MKSYQPIDCNFYDLLEAAAVQGKTVQLEYAASNSAENIENVEISTRIVDLYARNGEEFLVLENQQTIRLDQLLSMDGNKLKGFCAI